MGRPKKQVEPEVQADSSSTTESEDTLKELNQKSVLDELALGISKTKDGWAVVEIVYNAESGESDLQDIHIAGINKEAAIEMFKILAVQKGLV
jgi:hypothetical protein